jgi:hypothetical protein
MLTNGYGTQYFNEDLLATANATFQVIGQEQRWDLDTLHVKIENLDAGGTLVVGYGPNANTPEICRFNSVADTDVRIRNAGIDNPNQLPLNAVWSVGTGSGNLEGSITAGAHIVKQGGENFIALNSAPPFGAREEYGLETIGALLYVFCGFTTGAVNDMWSSPDGINWTQITPSVNLNARYAFATCGFVYNGVAGFLLAGGTDGTNFFNDVWFFGGSGWTELTANAAFSGRELHQMKMLNGILYLVGGYNGTTNLQDVWSSPDGITWTLVTATAGFGIRQNFQMQPFMGKLWVMGGVNGATVYSDSWSSPDGNTWIEAPTGNQFTKRYGHSSDVGFNGLGRTARLRVFGGNTGSGYLADGWESLDGGIWNQITFVNAFSARSNHASKKMGNSFYLGCGLNGSGVVGDMWRTTVPIV